jgi:hypothetical protein
MILYSISLMKLTQNITFQKNDKYSPAKDVELSPGTPFKKKYA